MLASVFAKNMPEVQIKLHTRKYKEIAGVRTGGALIRGAGFGEMPKPAWAFHQNTPDGEAVVLDMAEELHYWRVQLHLAQMRVGW